MKTKFNGVLMVLSCACLFTAFLASCGGESTQSNTENPSVLPTPPVVDTTTPQKEGVKQIVITPQNATVAIGMQLKLEAMVEYNIKPSDSDVTWSSSNDAVAVVKDGMVKGLKEGNVDIIATSRVDSSKKAVANIRVCKEATLDLDAKEMALIMGNGNGKLTATLIDCGEITNSCEFKSNNTSIVKATNDGTLTPVSTGTAEITVSAKTKSGKLLEAKCKVNVLADAHTLKNDVAGDLAFTINNVDDNAKLSYSVKANSKGIKNINIPDSHNGCKVSIIEENAFKDCNSIESFKMGKSITEIGANAFALELTWENVGNDNLQKVDHMMNTANRLNMTLELNYNTKISEYAFQKSFFKKVIIPEGALELPAYAFASSALQNIVFPTTLRKIKGYAFVGCSYLENADLSNTKIESIGEAGSDGISVGNSFFQCGSLRKIGVLPESLRTIEAYSFSVCSNLNEITLNRGLEKIGAQAFMHCTSIDEITIYDTVKTVGKNAFGRWSSTQMITVMYEENKLPEGFRPGWAGDNPKQIIFYK